MVCVCVCSLFLRSHAAVNEKSQHAGNAQFLAHGPKVRSVHSPWFRGAIDVYVYPTSHAGTWHGIDDLDCTLSTRGHDMESK